MVCATTPPTPMAAPPADRSSSPARASVSPTSNSANPITVVTGDELFETGNDLGRRHRSTTCRSCATPSASRTPPASSAPAASTCSICAASARSARWCWSTAAATSAATCSATACRPTSNTFPTDLIERVDIVTGGASAVYGSDAIAGVVNFILKDDFEGIQLRGQTGVSKYNDAGNQYVSLLAGTNFADDRGNIAVNLEYAHSAATSPRVARTCANNAFVVTDADAAGSSTVRRHPDRIFFSDIRSPRSRSAAWSRRSAANRRRTCGVDPNGAALYLHLPVPARRHAGPADRHPRRPRRQRQLPRRQRLQRPRRASCSRCRPSSSAIGQPDRPFRDLAGVRAVLRSEVRPDRRARFAERAVLLAGHDARAIRRRANSSVSTTRTFCTGARGPTDAPRDQRAASTPTRPRVRAQPAAPTAAAPAQLGGRSGSTCAATGSTSASATRSITRETYRGVVGVRGDFNDDWNYEVSANYGEHSEKNIILGNVNVQRYLLGSTPPAMRPARSSAARSSTRPRDLVPDRQPAQRRRRSALAADIAACVPINPFGQGSVSQAAQRLVTSTRGPPARSPSSSSAATSRAIPAGSSTCRAARSGSRSVREYRRETLRYDLDDLTQEGYAFYNAIPTFKAPVVRGEGSLRRGPHPDPQGHAVLRGTDHRAATAVSRITRARPARSIVRRRCHLEADRGHHLPRQLCPRGTCAEPYRPVLGPGPELRTGLRRSVLGGQPRHGFATRAANCTAAGRPAGYDFLYIASLEIVSGGNPDLTRGKVGSYTAGILLQPRFIPGLSLSADYYDITSIT